MSGFRRRSALAAAPGICLAGLLLVSSCTVDEDVVEGKVCYMTGTDPNAQCASGYECKCELGKCTCQKSAAKESSLTSSTAELFPGSEPAAHAGPAPREDASARFLRQRGVLLRDR